MNGTPEDLTRFQDCDPDVASMLALYREAQGVYEATLEAMGLVSQPVLAASFSSSVIVDADPGTALTSL